MECTFTVHFEDPAYLLLFLICREDNNDGINISKGVTAQQLYLLGVNLLPLEDTGNSMVDIGGNLHLWEHPQVYRIRHQEDKLWQSQAASHLATCKRRFQSGTMMGVVYEIRNARNSAQMFLTERKDLVRRL